MEKLRVRTPVVAGQFYPGTVAGLRNQIRSFVEPRAEKIDAIACLLPHAGYVYSGRVAVTTVNALTVKDTVLLLGPNHTGRGAPFAIMTEGSWQTPLGEVKINSSLAKLLLERCPRLEDDSLAHAYEHSLEVELPILQYFKSDFTIVPIAISSDDVSLLKKIGDTIAEVIQETGLKNASLIVASSDMTHYESEEQAKKKDNEAIRALLELNADALFKKIAQYAISMCGYAPAAVMLAAAKGLGATKGTLIMYQTSGAVTGDHESVVGYAGIAVS